MARALVAPLLLLPSACIERCSLSANASSGAAARRHLSRHLGLAVSVRLIASLVCSHGPTHLLRGQTKLEKKGSLIRSLLARLP
jgi:hypothetical protein